MRMIGLAYWFCMINCEVKNVDKQTFILHIKPLLKDMGYRKKSSYWYRACEGYVFCVNVQGSQWDPNNYYVEIGIAYPNPDVKNPNVLQWYCRHRCRGKNGSVNITIDEFMNFLKDFENTITSADIIPSFLSNNNASKVVNQFWF